MSRYVILLILNLPIILAAIVSSYINYKTGRSNRRKLVFQISFWVIVLIGLSSTKPLYDWLFSQDLTRTEPLSLFDVIQITAIIILLFSVNRFRSRLDYNEEKIEKLNTLISIKFSTIESLAKSKKIK